MGRFLKKKANFDLNCNGTPRTSAAQTLPGDIATAKSCQICRYYIATLGFIAHFMVNFQRMGMAVTVVYMAKSPSGSSTRQSNSSLTSCPITNNTAQDLEELQTRGDFDWSPQMQGFILGSAFLGFAFGLFIGGRLSDKYGAKGTMFWGNTVSSAGMLLCPIFSWWNVYSLIVLHFIRGICQGFIMPSNYTLLAKWTPRSERSFISTFIITGFYVGSMTGGLVAGSICQNPFLGWSAVYYIKGTVGLLFSPLFLMTYFETPEEHPGISEAELKYITHDRASVEKQMIHPIPWLKMLTCLPTYALFFGLFAFSWKILYFLTVHPAYLSNILHYSIMKSGFLVSMSFLTKIAGSLFVSALADCLYRRKYIGVNKLRKGLTLIGCSIFSLSMLGLYFAECNELLNTVFESTSLLGAGVVTSGAPIAAVDMAPNFAGSLLGLVNSVACTNGFIIPVVIGFLTKDQTLEGWQHVFLMNMAVVMTCGIIFAVFGSAEVQTWNFVTDESIKIKSDIQVPPTIGNCAKEDHQC